MLESEHLALTTCSQRSTEIFIFRSSHLLTFNWASPWYENSPHLHKHQVNSFITVSWPREDRSRLIPCMSFAWQLQCYLFLWHCPWAPLSVSEQWEAESKIMERKWCSQSCQSRAGAHQGSLLTPVPWVSRDSQPSRHSTHRAEQTHLLYRSNNCSHRPCSECCYFSTPKIWKPQVLISNPVFLRKKWYIQMHSKAWALTKGDYPPLYFHFTFLLIFHICSVLSDKFYFYLYAFSCSQSNWNH